MGQPANANRSSYTACRLERSESGHRLFIALVVTGIVLPSRVACHLAGCRYRFLLRAGLEPRMERTRPRRWSVAAGVCIGRRKNRIYRRPINALASLEAAGDLAVRMAGSRKHRHTIDMARRAIRVLSSVSPSPVMRRSTHPGGLPARLRPSHDGPAGLRRSALARHAGRWLTALTGDNHEDRAVAQGDDVDDRRFGSEVLS